MGTPPTAAVLAPVPASGWNVMAADLTDSGWVPIVPVTGYTAGNNCAYRVIGERVYLRGTIAKNAGTIPNGTTLTTLPSPACPIQNTQLPLGYTAVSAGNYGRILVTSGGVLTMDVAVTATSTIALDNLSWFTD